MRIINKIFRLKSSQILWLALSVPFFLPLRAQVDWNVLFQDDFEDGNLETWHIGPLYENAEFSIEPENSSHVLSGTGHGHAAPSVDIWRNYSFKTDIKLIDNKSGVHLNYRENKGVRYSIGLTANIIYLNKSKPAGNHIELISIEDQFDFGQWYTAEIIGLENNIKLYIDGINKIDYTDSDPIDFGTSNIETLENSHVHFDNVIIQGEKAPVLNTKWIRTGGPSGGLGYDVRIHPKDKNIMFVTDNPSGVNKSYDSGYTWFQKNTGILNRTGASGDGVPIFSLTIDPNNPDIVWSGTQNSKGIYKSTDSGNTWTKKDNGVVEGDEISFRNFGIHPYNSDIVFAGAEIAMGNLGIEFDKTRGKIYKTEDGGENWRCVWEGDNLVRFVLFDPTNPDIMYASTGIFDREAHNTEGVGILKSTDSGETWFQINNGIPNTKGNRFVGFLEMHPTDPQILFAASGNNAMRSGGIFRTTNSGASWEKVLSEETFSIVTISPSNPDVIYAGGELAFFRSDDGGTKWQKFQKDAGGYGPPGIRAGFPISAVVDPDDPYTVFANNYGGGNFKSTDGGQNWVNSSKGYTGADLHDIAIDPYNPACIYTIGRSGPFRSCNSGEDWTGISFPPAVEAEWYAVALNPANTQEVLVSDEFSGTIWKSTDGGDSWRTVFKNPKVKEGDPQEARHGFKDIVYAPSAPNIVYAGMSKGRRTIDGDFPPRSSFGMYKSTDSGESWSEINTGLSTSFLNINSIAVNPTDHKTVYIGTWKDGIFKTTDGGQNWVLKSNGLTSSDVRALAIDPKNPDVVYAGLGEGAGILKTTNSGELWGEINCGLQIECPQYLLPMGKVSQNTSLTKIPRRRIGADYYSVPWTSVRSIVIDPTNSQRIYAADYHSGVYVSSDRGTIWAVANEGLSTRAVTSMDISANGKVLYASTSGEGVFRLVLKNYAPEILSTVPHAESTVSIAQGDSTRFSVIAFDLNNDTLSYSWTLNGIKIKESDSTEHLLKTPDMVSGDHVLTVEIADNDTSISVTWNISITDPTRVEDREISGMPNTFALHQNYPNPFNPETVIRYQIPKTTIVSIKIYNLQGQEIKTLVNNKKEAGYHRATWDGKDSYGNPVASDVYLYRLDALTDKQQKQQFVRTRKMILLQ